MSMASTTKSYVGKIQDEWEQAIYFVALLHAAQRKCEVGKEKLWNNTDDVKIERIIFNWSRGGWPGWWL